jgi:uncharacterized protein (TIGR00299 family) protein
MRVAYVEMIGGAAGDMLAGAFLDAGLDAGVLERALRTVVADGWTFAPQQVLKRGISARFAGITVPGEDGAANHVHAAGDGHHAKHRTLRDVLAILAASGLSARARERAAAVYTRLAHAEARVHGSDVDAIAFHEVGQLDAILDVAATCVALDELGIDELRASPFPLGHGTIAMAHGTYPNPPPATAQLLLGWPTRTVEIDRELVTTTAAAILTTLATPGPRPEMTLDAIGYGAGSNDFPFPNVTRVSIGTVTAALGAAGDNAPDVVVLEANIDDMSPQHYELAVERVFAAGAHDVWLTPIIMKKGRPAITLSALADPADERAVARAMLTQTTTIGVRVRAERRHVLPRSVATIETPLGSVRVKRSGTNGTLRVRPEYDDLARIARERALPLAEVVRIVETSLAGMPPS